MSVPTVLTVPGFFSPSQKYSSSVAMILDQADNYDDEYGDVNDYGSYGSLFWDIDIEQAYKVVGEFIDDYPKTNLWVLWSEVKQMIDILTEGRNWIVTTDSQGFVGVEGFETATEARKVFEQRQTDYHVWSSQREIPKVDL